MPHTSRKKHTLTNKRLQVTDDSGWTHITTGGNRTRARRVPRDGDGDDDADQLRPAEAPSSTTLADLQTQLTTYQRSWVASPTCAVVRDAVHEMAASPITNVVCIGLGSPSGFLRGGWVDRRSVSMYQLAALVSVIEELHASSADTIPVPVYAQDPVFNALDESLLAALHISVVQHPAAFDEISSRTLLFCPGAERAHLEELLRRPEERLPAGLIGGPLEDAEPEAISRFARARRSVRLPVFEDQEHAFWNMRVYLPAEER
ncbi:hypothetical protein BDV59DRAFT_199300 [Aspergillus ambiguus]|uniref:SRR1 family protein n=1 Tax=Aspergillus ambiguus TaxID=176160 RepID=UPI003CCCED7E